MVLLISAATASSAWADCLSCSGSPNCLCYTTCSGCVSCTSCCTLQRMSREAKVGCKLKCRQQSAVEWSACSTNCATEQTCISPGQPGMFNTEPW